MFRIRYSILAILLAAGLVIPSLVFSAEKTDKDAILQEISNFIDKNPDVIKGTVYSMADDYMRQNKIDEAIALYEKALKVLPNSEDLLNRMADIYNRKSDYLKATEVYKKITELKPDSVFNFQKLASAYKSAGQKDKAVQVWENLMKDSKNPGIFMQAANFYNGEKDADKAIAAVKKAIELAPDNMNYLQTIEGFYMKADKFSEAEAACDKIFAGAKDKWLKDWADTELVNIYQKQNKLADLAAKFEKDLAQAPNDINKYKKLADIYQRNNEQDKAIAQYRKAQAIDAGNLWYTMSIADIFIVKKNFDAAKKELNDIIAKTADNWMKQEAERKLKGMELSQKTAAIAPQTMPAANTKAAAVPKPAPVKPEEKKKGSFPLFR